VVETERHLFLEKHIVTLSHVAHLKLVAIVYDKSHRFSLLPSSPLSLIHCSLHRISSDATMPIETIQTTPTTGDAARSGSMGGTRVESNTSSSSSNVAMQTIAKKKVPMLYEYWKALMITEAGLSAYHISDWLPGGMLSSTTNLEFPTINKTNIVCCESHLMVGLGLPLGKFLVSILNYLRCELVHLNLNAIIAHSYFSMLCECWLRIPPDTYLFWYFYYPARYDNQVFSGIGLTLHRHRRHEYLDATFRGYWKGASQRWFHVDIHACRGLVPRVPRVAGYGPTTWI
jgi:hypothetical protein